MKLMKLDFDETFELIVTVSSFFPNSQKFYNEYVKTTKSGGCGYTTHDSIRTAENCFSEFISINPVLGY